MKNKTQKITILLLVFLVFSGCDTDKDIMIGDPSEFTVDIRELRLVREVGTVFNIPVETSALGFAMRPANATRNTVNWTSSNENIATVSDTGEITITSVDPIAPRTTIIRVESEFDPSIFAECALTVYPIYSMPRNWNFTAGSVRVNNSVITGSTGDASGNWTLYNSDGDLGNGAVVLGASGGADDYIATGAGVHEIDPENPYQHGLVPNGNPRTWSYVSAGPNIPTGWSFPLIRPAGMGRFVKINAVQGPFRIIVDYQGNNTAGSQVDIRIGDTSGIRIEGEPSMDATAAGGKTVSYDFTSDDFVPVIFLETNDGTRIWSIRISRLTL